MYCPECGADHHASEREEKLAEQTAVTLAKIEAGKAVEIERIRAGAARDLAEVDNALKTEHAEGIAEGMETALEAAAGGAQAPEEPGEPIIVEAPEEPELGEPEPELAPPPAEPSTPASSERESGWWSGYQR
jgi:hypothetical protein